MFPYVVILSGPEKTRAKAELALEKARLTIIPSKEWPICRESYRAEHWPHLSQLPSGKDPREEHGFVAVLAEDETEFHAAYSVVEKAKWVLRVHRELGEKPKPPEDPFAVLFQRMDAQEQRIAELTRKLGGIPSIGGAAFENSGVPAFTQAGSFSAEQSRRAWFSAYARTPANSPGIISGGLLSSADLQLSNAVSGLVVNYSTGEAIIPGNEGGAQGGYYARNASSGSLTLATASGSNPRIDLICLTVDDTGYTPPSGGTSGQVTAQAVTGTPTSGATLTNLSGVASLPASSLLLGYALVPTSATDLSGGDIKNVATSVLLSSSSTTVGTVMQPSRAINTVYQPNTARPTLVIVLVGDPVADALAAVIGATSSPATTVAECSLSAGTGTLTSTMTFYLPTAWYYNLDALGSPSTLTVTEVTL